MAFVLHPSGRRVFLGFFGSGRPRRRYGESPPGSLFPPLSWRRSSPGKADFSGRYGEQSGPAGFSAALCKKIL